MNDILIKAVSTDLHIQSVWICNSIRRKISVESEHEPQRCVILWRTNQTLEKKKICSCLFTFRIASFGSDLFPLVRDFFPNYFFGSFWHELEFVLLVEDRINFINVLSFFGQKKFRSFLLWKESNRFVPFNERILERNDYDHLSNTVYLRRTGKEDATFSLLSTVW